MFVATEVKTLSPSAEATLSGEEDRPELFGTLVTPIAAVATPEPQFDQIREMALAKFVRSANPVISLGRPPGPPWELFQTLPLASGLAVGMAP